MQRILASLLVAVVGCSTEARAGGASGHHMISAVFMDNLPPELPAFLKTPDARYTVSELGREHDRSKASGETHDKDLDPAHYLDLDDEGRVFGGPALMTLPTTREDFNSAMRVVGKTQYDSGYLPYAIVSGWQQLAKDFGYWRALVAAERNATDPAKAALFARDRQLREMLILRDLGTWTHYVADASQPLHLSVHFNGWGDYLNPGGYTVEKIHARFEGAFVRANVTAAEIAARVPAPQLGEDDIWQRTKTYLAATHAEVIPLYQIEKAHGFDLPSEPAETFVLEQMARAVAELRDLTAIAWAASETASLGHPPITLRDIEAGADPTAQFFGTD